MRVLVLGAGGFLGAHLMRSLIRHGHTPAAGVRKTSDLSRLEEVRGAVQTVAVDVTDHLSIQEGIKRIVPDAVINCAAYGVDFRQQDYSSAMQVNVQGAVNLLREAAHAGVSKYIQIGSCFEYGHKKHFIKEDEVLEPTHIYGATKACASLLISQWAREQNFPAVILRSFGMWGETEVGFHLVPQIVKACITKTPLDLTPGEQIRDYTYVEDMADNIVSYLESAEFMPGDIVNVGSGQAIRLRDFVLEIASVLGGQQLMRFGRLPYRPNEMMMLVANTEKFSKVIPKNRIQEHFNERVKKMASLLE